MEESKELKTFTFDTEWIMTKRVTIQAETLAKAYRYIMSADFPLPEDTYYLDESFVADEVDEDLISE